MSKSLKFCPKIEI